MLQEEYAERQVYTRRLEAKLEELQGAADLTSKYQAAKQKVRLCSCLCRLALGVSNIWMPTCMFVTSWGRHAPVLWIFVLHESSAQQVLPGETCEVLAPS